VLHRKCYWRRQQGIHLEFRFQSEEVLSGREWVITSAITAEKILISPKAPDAVSDVQTK
jgi:hypothetical protein